MEWHEGPAGIAEKEKEALVKKAALVASGIRDDQPSRALVPFAPALPATGVLNIADEARSRLEEIFLRQQNFDIERCGGNIELKRITALAGGMFTFAIAAIAPPAGLLLAGVVGVLAIAVGAAGVVDEHIMRETLIANKINWTKGALRQEFMSAQKDSYLDQKRELVRAAEQYLDAGNLIGMEDAAWLAALDPEALDDAGDQLAITVLQIRKMLAHVRCRDYDTDGSKKVTPVKTFASMWFGARSFLRERLLACDIALSEDSNPVLKEPEVVGDVEHKLSVMRSLRAFFSMETQESVRREFADGALPRFKDIEMPQLKPVEDFAAALEEYEANNPPLDLPAIRGWQRYRRPALPPPQRPAIPSYPLI
jgi:hypothetical protein